MGSPRFVKVFLYHQRRRPCTPSDLPWRSLVHRLANTLAFERRCIRSSFLALLHPTQRYASVARLAGAAHRRSRCVKLFTRRFTRGRVYRKRLSKKSRMPRHPFRTVSTSGGEGGSGHVSFGTSSSGNASRSE